MLRPFLIALQFLTRLPVPDLGETSDRDAGRSVLYYPVVGLVLGLLLAAVNRLLHGAPESLVAALLLVIWVLTTGGLHIDGLADSADAWVGGHGNRERTLAIMKDPRSGPAGVAAVVLVLLVKFAALEVILYRNAWPELVLVPVLGRVSVMILFVSTPYVRRGGIGEPMANHLPTGGVWSVLLLTAVAVLLTTAWHGFIALAAVATLGYLLRRIMMRQIGGATGDTAGAFVELLESAALTSFALTL